MSGALLMALALTTSPPSMADLSEQPVARSTPAGFLQMFVAGVMPQGDEHTLVLVNPEKELLMPVGVGLPEAVSIFGRLEHKTAPRPLTHDLLENVVAALGASVVRVQIDDLRDGAFIGTVFLRGKDGRDLHLDARVSDAVVMALSAGAPIFVAAPVVARAALTRDDLERMPAERPEPPPGPTKTFDL